MSAPEARGVRVVGNPPVRQATVRVYARHVGARVGATWEAWRAEHQAPLDLEGTPTAGADGALLLDVGRGELRGLPDLVAEHVEGCARFLGSAGVRRVDTRQRHRHPSAAAREPEPLPEDRPNGFDAEIRESVAAVLEGRPPAATGEDAGAALELIQAIGPAAESGRVVRLPLEDGR